MQYAEKHRTDYYRRLADLTRASAEKQSDPRVRVAMLETASIWDRLARIEERRCDRLRSFN